MSKDLINAEIVEKLFYGLPDSRICKVARKVTVVSDKGTKIVLKDRGVVENEEPVFLYEPLEYNDLDNVISKLEHKEVVVTSAVYNSSKVRELLADI